MSGDCVVMEAEGTDRVAFCPSCGVPTDKVHDRYKRRAADLPWRSYRVILAITVRRFVCRNRSCRCFTFAEDFGEKLPRYARRTSDATALLLNLAKSTSCETASRLAKGIGLPISPDTLLRLLRNLPEPEHSATRILGVDDLALRKRQSYATILIDMETHRPIDLLMGRDAKTLAAWLREHPGVEVVVRDRAEAYAEGARLGAPEAIQVADRFHLLQNAGAALEELLRRRRRWVEHSELEQIEEQNRQPQLTKTPSKTKQRKTAQQRARAARWERVCSMRKQGMSISTIARELGMARRTVRHLLATKELPHNIISNPRPSGLSSPMLQPYVTYLQDRWQAGCTNFSQLYRELVALGYTGSRSLVAQSLQPWRGPRLPSIKRPRIRDSVRSLCLRPPEKLGPEQSATLHALLAKDEELALGYGLVQRFREVITAHDVHALEGWLTEAEKSNLSPFVGLANGIRADRAAVDAALTTSWSNGLVEGHIHRVKLIKRQGYGRAKMDLLRRRILAA